MFLMLLMLFNNNLMLLMLFNNNLMLFNVI
jgi:hypothetical protein